jgi:arginine exporter protein ArgO
MDSLLYKILLLLHLATVIVGFGSAFVYPVLRSQARRLPANEAHAINHASFAVTASLSTYPTIAAGVFGILLIVTSDEVFKFSQTWVSIAFLLWLLVLAVAFLLHQPNLKAMDALGQRLADGSVTESRTGGEPKEVVELKEREAKAASFSGMMHLLWFLLLIDMIWKPGL